MRIHLAMLRSAAWLVPGEQRAEWLAEWSAELWYVGRSCRRQATGFCLGAFRDALWLRRNRPPDAPRAPWFESPARCLGSLGLLAAACVLLALRHHRPDMPLPVRGPILAMLYLAMMALPILPAITSLRLGEYPANRNAWWWDAMESARPWLPSMEVRDEIREENSGELGRKKQPGRRC